MNEYTAKIKSVANEIIGLRSTSGTTATTIMFGVLSLLKSKDQLSDTDLDIIFKVEKEGLIKTVQDHFDKNYGDPRYPISNDQELEDVKSACVDYIDNMKSIVIEAAKELKVEEVPLVERPTRKSTRRKT